MASDENDEGTAVKIERVRAGSVSVDDLIVQEDAEDLTNDAINADWDADEQDWQRVCDVRGHADVGALLLQTHNGERVWTPIGDWSQYVWRLTDDDGVPYDASRDDD